MKVGDFRAVEPHGCKLQKHRLGAGTANIIFDERYFDEDVVGMAKHGLPAAKDIKFRSLRIDLDEVEVSPSEQIVDSNLVNLTLHDNLVAEKWRVLAVERTAGGLQPLLGQEQLRTARFVRSGHRVLLEGKLRQLVLAKGIGLDQRGHAIGKHIEKRPVEGSNRRTDIEHGRG